MVETKQIPSAPDLEVRVIGTLISEPKAFGYVASLLTKDLFYDEKLKQVLGGLMALFNNSEPINLISLTMKLKKMGLFNEIGGAYFLTKINDQSEGSANIEYNVRILTQFAIKRSLIDTSWNLNKAAYDPNEDVLDTLDRFQREVTRITGSIVTEKVLDIRQLYLESVEKTRAIKAAKNGIIGVPSGFIDLDRVTGGWQKTDLIIIAARPGMGKTSFVVNCLRNAAVDHKVPVGMFSLEMSAGQLMNRMRSSESEIPLEKYTKQGLTDQEEVISFSKCDHLVDQPIYIDDTGGISMFQLRNKARKMKKDYGIGLIVIDYLQLITIDGTKVGNRESEVSSISRQLKALAKELDIPLIALSQLNRGVEGRGNTSNVPKLSDLRDSGAIEQDADMVMFIYRPEYYGITEDADGQSVIGKAKLIIAKHRNGALDSVKLRFNGPLVKFTDDSHYFEEIPRLTDAKDFTPFGEREPNF